MTEKVDTTTLAFTWAVFSAAETLLGSLPRNSPKARSHAELMLDFIRVGKLGLPASHYVELMAEKYPELIAYKYAANRLLKTITTEQQAAE